MKEVIKSIILKHLKPPKLPWYSIIQPIEKKGGEHKISTNWYVCSSRIDIHCKHCK